MVKLFMDRVVRCLSVAEVVFRCRPDFSDLACTFDSLGKNTQNLRNNGRMRVKFDKWLVHIPFLCYLTILLISAEGAVYGGY